MGRANRSTAVLRRGGRKRRAEGPLACVLGQDQIDLFRALALAGIRSAGVTPSEDPVRASRFLVASVDWVSHWTRQEELLARLERFGAEMPVRPVLFYQSDGDMLVVSRNRERLRRVFDFTIADESVVERSLDKAEFYRTAEQLEIPVPRTAYIPPGRGVAPVEDLRLPVVVKLPIRRYSDWASVAGSAKAIRAETTAELKQLVDRFSQDGVAVLVQESIPGPESRIESYHSYVDERGDRAAEFTGRKIRTYPREYGESTALETTRAPDVVELGREVVAKLGLRGVCKVDFKRTPSGVLEVLEVNPRFNLWHHLGAVAGVNLPAFVYADLTGRQRPQVRPARAGVRWCDWELDRHAAREQGMTSVSWALWLLGTEAKSGLWWDDPMPFVKYHLVPATARRLRRPWAHVARGGRR